MLDVDAVVERLGLERFDLLACIHAGPLGIAYAARHPERLSHLVLCSAYSRGSDFVQSPEVQGARAVLDKDWYTFSETASRAIAAGWEARELPAQLAELIRECTTQDVWQVFAPLLADLDVTDLLPELRVPTLVLHSRQGRILPVDVARGIAGRIPDARLALLEGEVLMPYIGDTLAVVKPSTSSWVRLSRKILQPKCPHPALPRSCCATSMRSLIA